MFLCASDKTVLRAWAYHMGILMCLLSHAFCVRVDEVNANGEVRPVRTNVLSPKLLIFAKFTANFISDSIGPTGLQSLLYMRFTEIFYSQEWLIVHKH
jgi:hypothetical protein